MQRRDELIARAADSQSNGLAPRAILELSKLWPPGHRITVAFRGGDTTLHRRIAEVASQWAQHGSLTFDFGYDAATDTFRRWSPRDWRFVADIRIGFSELGYWSLLGTDSRNPLIVRPGEASMNLEGFDGDFPPDGDGTILHEFGHALGFHHEHQHPQTPCDFRWNDDPGYIPTRNSFGQFKPDSAGRRPGIYTVLGGPPNNWPPEVVDHNLRQLQESPGLQVGVFDPKSIMKYALPAWMFRSGHGSHCFATFDNSQISTLDAAGLAQAYPTTDPSRAQLANALTDLQKHVADPMVRQALRTTYDATVENPFELTVHVPRAATPEAPTDQPEMVTETRTRKVSYYTVNEHGEAMIESRPQEYTVRVPRKLRSPENAPSTESHLITETTPVSVTQRVRQYLQAHPHDSLDKTTTSLAEEFGQNNSTCRDYLKREIEWVRGEQPSTSTTGPTSQTIMRNATVIESPLRRSDKFGRFLGRVAAEWHDDGRTMTLIEDFSFVDPHGKIWTAEKGVEVNGASIPRVFWTAIGGPFEGRYRLASVVHDAHCVTRVESWQAVHRMFYEACRAAGVDRTKANAMYFAVYRFGPRWERRMRRPSSEEGPLEEYSAMLPTRAPEMNKEMAHEIMHYFERYRDLTPDQIDDLTIADVIQECDSCGPESTP